MCQKTQEWPLLNSTAVIQCHTMRKEYPVQLAIQHWQGPIPPEVLKAFDQIVEALDG